MKRLKYGVFALILVCACCFMSACDIFSTEPRLEEFVVQHTQNLEFLVGEDYHDELIKGTAFYSDDTEVDVTEEMEIDKSDYDKTQVGTYEIKFTYKKVQVSYDVKVVNKITNTININNRMVDVIGNTFQRVNGVLSFEAKNETTYEGLDFAEDLVYVDNNGVVSAYVGWSLSEMKFIEFYFNGTKESGNVSIVNAFEGGIMEHTDLSIDDFSMIVLQSASEAQIPAVLSPSGVLALEEDTYAGELTLNNNVYTLTFEDYSLQYKNNKIISLNGVTITFPKKSSTIIPARETIQSVMDEVVQQSYKRTNGQLQIEAGAVVDLGNNVSIEHEFVIQEDNEEYFIYNNFTMVGAAGSTSYECWYEGSLESGKLTTRVMVGQTDEQISCENNKSLDEFMQLLYVYQLGLNQNGVNYEIALFPYNMILLEVSEFSGMLEPNGNVWMLTQEVEEGVEFTLKYINNKIFEVNGYNVTFGDTISGFAIPSVPSVA